MCCRCQVRGFSEGHLGVCRVVHIRRTLGGIVLDKLTRVIANSEGTAIEEC